MSLYPPILLVEDNPLDVDLTLRAFQRRKLINPVLVARDGEGGLGVVATLGRGRDPAIRHFIDLNLPRVDGLTVLRTLKQHAVLCRIPVVVLTTSKEDRDIQAAYDLGVNSYIVKPVGFDSFMDVAQHIELYWCVLNEHPQ